MSAAPKRAGDGEAKAMTTKKRPAQRERKGGRASEATATGGEDAARLRDAHARKTLSPKVFYFGNRRAMRHQAIMLRASGAISAEDAKEALRQVVNEYTRWAYTVQYLLLGRQIRGDAATRLVSPLLAVVKSLNKIAPNDPELKTEARVRREWPAAVSPIVKQRERALDKLCKDIEIGEAYRGGKRDFKDFDEDTMAALLVELITPGWITVRRRLVVSPWGFYARSIAMLEGCEAPPERPNEAEAFAGEVADWLRYTVFGDVREKRFLTVRDREKRMKAVEAAARFGPFQRFAMHKAKDGSILTSRPADFWHAVLKDIKRAAKSLKFLSSQLPD